MNKTQTAVLVLAACMIMVVPVASWASGDWRDAWLANYPDPCADLITAAQSCVLCHSSVPSLNSYGADMGSMDFTAIEGLDSDGDGVTNGQEINVDCTLPGDPSSVPVTVDTWGDIKALFR